MLKGAMTAFQVAYENKEKLDSVKEFYEADELLPARVKDAVKSVGSSVKSVGSSVKSVGSAVKRHGPGQRNNQRGSMKDGPGSKAFKALGLEIMGKDGKYVAPASKDQRVYPQSRMDMMEGVISTIKQAYFPDRINIATWDAALTVDAMTCHGLAEYGTVKSANGLEYRFAVFRGIGHSKWRGGVPTGVPDLACSGSISLGPDFVWFNSTDPSSEHAAADLVELMAMKR